MSISILKLHYAVLYSNLKNLSKNSHARWTNGLAERKSWNPSVIFQMIPPKTGLVKYISLLMRIRLNHFHSCMFRHKNFFSYATTFCSGISFESLSKLNSSINCTILFWFTTSFTTPIHCFISLFQCVLFEATSTYFFGLQTTMLQFFSKVYQDALKN